MSYTPAAISTRGQSPEEVAYKLLECIAWAEQKQLIQAPGIAAFPSPNRQWILDTYAECLEAVRNPQGRLTPSGLRAGISP